MPEESSTISAVVRSLDGNEALVEVEHGGCGRCHEKGGCGGQRITQMFCGGPRTYRVENAVGANPGERVTVAIAGGSLRRSANLAYGLPLTATIAGALLGTWISGDSGGIVGAVFGLMLSFSYVRFRAQDAAGNMAARPHIVSRP